MVVNLKNFSDELHYEAKVQAAIEKISLKDLIEKAVSDILQEQRRKGGNDHGNLGGVSSVSQEAQCEGESLSLWC